MLSTIFHVWLSKVSWLSLELFIETYQILLQSNQMSHRNMITAHVSCFHISSPVSPWLVTSVLASRNPVHSSTTRSNITSFVRDKSLLQWERLTFVARCIAFKKGHISSLDALYLSFVWWYKSRTLGRFFQESWLSWEVRTCALPSGCEDSAFVLWSDYVGRAAF